MILMKRRLIKRQIKNKCSVRFYYTREPRVRDPDKYGFTLELWRGVLLLLR